MKTLLVAIGLTMILFAESNAQITPNVYKSMEYRREMTKIIGRGLVNQQILGRGANGKNSKSSAPKTQVATGATAFKFNDKYLSPDILLANFKRTASEKSKAAQNISEAIDSYKNIAKKDGFPANDLAYSFNFFIIHNLIIYHSVKCTALELGLKGREDSCSIFTAHNFTLDQERGVYNQFRQVLDSPEIAKMTDADKQLMAEMIALKIFDIWSRWGELANRPMSIENYNIKMEAAKNLEDFLKIPVKNISATKDGINF